MTESTSVGELELRIRALERRQRRWLLGGLCLLALPLAALVPTLVTGQSRPGAAADPLVAATDTAADAAKVVRCDRLEITGADGRVIASLGRGDGGATLELVSASGQERITLDFVEEPNLALRDAAGVPRARLFHNPDVTGLYLQDAAGHTRVGVAQFPHGGGVALHGVESKGAVVLTLLEQKGSLRMFDVAGTVVEQYPAEPRELTAAPAPGPTP